MSAAERWPGMAEDLRRGQWTALRRHELALQRRRAEGVAAVERELAVGGQALAEEAGQAAADAQSVAESLRALDALRGALAGAAAAMTAVLPAPAAEDRAWAAAVGALKRMDKAALDALLAPQPLVAATEEETRLAALLAGEARQSAIEPRGADCPLTFLQRKAAQLERLRSNAPSGQPFFLPHRLAAEPLESLQRAIARRGLLAEFAAWRLSLGPTERLAYATPSPAVMKAFVGAALAQCARILARLRAKGRRKPAVGALLAAFRGEGPAEKGSEAMSEVLAALGSVTPEVFPELREWVEAKLRKELRSLLE